MPSEWVQRAVMSWLRGRPDLLPYYLLWSTAAAGVGARRAAASLAVRRRLQQGAGERASSMRERARCAHSRTALLSPFGVVRRELVLKEMRLFFRDTTQWSQLILLAVLVMVYVFNIKFLPLRGEGMTFFLVNVVPFLNLVLAGFVLASVAARFIFPGVSLEGRTLWLLRSSPMSMRELLWSKFWVGHAAAAACSRVAIVGVTDYLLQVSEFMMLVSVFTITLMTLARRGPGDRLRHAVPAVRDGERRADPDVVRRAGVHDELRGADRRRRHARGEARVHLPLVAGVRDAGRSARAWCSASAPPSWSAATATLVPIAVALRRLERLRRSVRGQRV